MVGVILQRRGGDGLSAILAWSERSKRKTINRTIGDSIVLPNSPIVIGPTIVRRIEPKSEESRDQPSAAALQRGGTRPSHVPPQEPDRNFASR